MESKIHTKNPDFGHFLCPNAEIVETTLGYPKYRRIIVISHLIYFRILMLFLVISLNDRHFLELTFVSGAD